MAVYFINIILLFLWSIPLLYNHPSDTKKKIYCGIGALQWILISGLRHISVGADTYEYYLAFEREMTTPWSVLLKKCWDYLFNGLETKDPGYYLLQKIFQVFSDSYQVYLIFIAVLFTGLMAWWIYRNSTMPEMSFFIYSTLFYSFYAVTGHRQTIATALVVFLGYELIKDKKYLQFAVVAFVAFMIHKSSIVFVLYFLIAQINISFIYVVLVSVAIGVVTFLGKQLYGPIALILGFDEDYIYNETGGIEEFATFLLLVCIATFVLYPWIKKQREDYKFIYNMMFLVTASTLLLYTNQTFIRIQQYFSLMIMIILPELILSIEKKYRVLAYMAVVAVLGLHLYRAHPHYQFFFM